MADKQHFDIEFETIEVQTVYSDAKTVPNGLKDEFLFPTVKDHPIRRRLKDLCHELFWTYTPFWETELADDFQNGIMDDEELFIIDQLWIPAMDVVFPAHMKISETDYPWHGHSLMDFQQLNAELQSCRPMIEAIASPKDVKRFRRKHRTVYETYFEHPLCVFKLAAGKFKFGSDGRHRIYTAQLANNSIPVWVVQYKKTEGMDEEYYKKRLNYGTWRFLRF